MSTGMSVRARAAGSVSVAGVALLLLGGCGAAAGREVGASPPPRAEKHGRATVHTLPLPVPSTYLRQLSKEQAGTYRSIPWGAPGHPTAGRPFTVTVDLPACTDLRGVHLEQRDDAVVVSVLGRTEPAGSICSMVRSVAITRVAWPSGMPPRGRITHAPTD